MISVVRAHLLHYLYLKAPLALSAWLLIILPEGEISAMSSYFGFWICDIFSLQKYKCLVYSISELFGTQDSSLNSKTDKQTVKFLIIPKISVEDFPNSVYTFSSTLHILFDSTRPRYNTKCLILSSLSILQCQ